MIGAVAAIGSLIFTGVATYYGAVVARQQLEQSQEDNERRTRDQANRVTFWEENPYWRGKKAGAIHLVNRSPDPVTNVEVRINVIYKGKHHVLQLPDYNLPPCTEKIFKMPDQTAVLSDGSQIDMADLTGWGVVLFSFEDSAGEDWARSSTFLVRGDLGREAARSWEYTGLVTDPEFQEKSAEPCGATS